VIVLDTSGLLAALFPDQRRHRECAEVLRSAEPPLILTPFVLAEVDYLVAKLAGTTVELELLAEVAARAFELVPFGADDVERCRRLIARFSDQAIGLADASVAVAAQSFGCREVLTLDERHFRVLPGPGGKPLRLLPADR
jgi:predicted nucleic acid-binding protein